MLKEEQALSVNRPRKAIARKESVGKVARLETSNFKLGWAITISLSLGIIVGATGCDEPANWSTPLDLVGDVDELIMQQPVAVSEHSHPPTTAISANSAPANPTEVVTRFATAAQRGDALELATLLTHKAQSQLQAQDVELATLGAAGNATFRVHEAEFLANGDAAHVSCLWTDGTTVEPEKIVFVLRRVQRSRQEKAVWRIAGLVGVSLKDPSLTVVIDLESPSDVAAFSTRQN